MVRDHDLSSFLRGGMRTNPYLIFASGAGDGGAGGAGIGQKTEKKQYPIKRAKEILIEQELKKYLSDSDLANQAVELAEQVQSTFDRVFSISDFDGLYGIYIFSNFFDFATNQMYCV